jgi:bacterioferritin-associated ferredoxin
LIFILNQARVGPHGAGDAPVIVCHCNGISDREIRRCIREGASSTREVAEACEATRGCGGCGPAIAEILASEIESRPAPLAPLAAPLGALSAG